MTLTKFKRCWMHQVAEFISTMHILGVYIISTRVMWQTLNKHIIDQQRTISPYSAYCLGIFHSHSPQSVYAAQNVSDLHSVTYSQRIQWVQMVSVHPIRYATIAQDRSQEHSQYSKRIQRKIPTKNGHRKMVAVNRESSFA